MRRILVVVSVVWIALALACATHFSPQTVRDEITRQTGQAPDKAFEFTLGEMTMGLAKRLAASASDSGELPLAGLDELELAVYPVPPGKAGALDFTLMPVRGWEPVVKVKGERGSGFVLVRAESGDTIGDLVVVAAGAEKVVYGRLKGRLPKSLPAALGEAVKSGGPALVERQLLDATTSADGEED